MITLELETRDVQHLLSNILENSAEARFIHRLHCVFLVRQGQRCSKVAEWFNYSPSTIARWVLQFNESGAEGLKDTPKPGRPQNLSKNQLGLLKKHVAQLPKRFGYLCPKWDGSCLQSHLETYFAISLSIRQCQRLLKQLREYPTATVVSTKEVQGKKIN